MFDRSDNDSSSSRGGGKEGNFLPHAPLFWALLLTLALFVVRVNGPSNLMDKDQQRPASYVLDAVLHGSWFYQRDWTGDSMSKPPLFTWIAAAATLPMREGNLVALYMPGLLAMLAIVGMFYVFGKGTFGWRAGFLAALMFVASPMAWKHIALARTDALFAATIALAAFLGFSAWNRRSSWIWFWLAAALATLTKGPLGLLLASLGLLAVVWDRLENKRDCAQTSEEGKADRKRFWIAQLVGVILFLSLSAGWFLLAYRAGGEVFLNKVIFRELVGHAVGSDRGSFGAGFTRAPLYWFSRFFPWSLLTIVAIWRVWRQPAADLIERRFERMLFWWIVGGLVVFSLARHQRGDLPLPLIVPAALLAGRELARWLSRWPDLQLQRRSVAFVAVFILGFTIYQGTAYAQTTPVRQSESVRRLAKDLRRHPVKQQKLLFVDCPYAFQFHLNRMEQRVGFDVAAGALAGDDPVFVAVRDLERLKREGGDRRADYHVIARTAGVRQPVVQIVTNPAGRALIQPDAARD